MRLVLAAFIGGTIGTSMRFAVELALPHSAEQFPTATLVVNVLGACALGVLVGGLWTRPAVPDWLKVTLGPGLLGSFTTFSAVMVSVVAQSSAGLWAMAAAYLASSVVLGLGAAAMGLRLGAHFAADCGDRRRAEGSE